MEEKSDLLTGALLQLNIFCLSLSSGKSGQEYDFVFLVLQVRCHHVQLVLRVRAERRMDRMEEGISKSLGCGQLFEAGLICRAIR